MEREREVEVVEMRSKVEKVVTGMKAVAVVVVVNILVVAVLAMAVTMVATAALAATVMAVAAHCRQPVSTPFDDKVLGSYVYVSVRNRYHDRPKIK